MIRERLSGDQSGEEAKGKITGTTLPAMANEVLFYSKHLRKSLRVFLKSFYTLYLFYLLPPSPPPPLYSQLSGLRSQIISKSIMMRARISATIEGKKICIGIRLSKVTPLLAEMGPSSGSAWRLPCHAT